MYYQYLEIAILSGNYHLAEIADKIYTLWVAGQITNEERSTLLSLAQEHCDPAQERPETDVLIDALTARLEILEARVTTLEGGDTDLTDYPDWEQPIVGLTSNYQSGAIVRHNGKLWISSYNGQNVWEPGETGTDALWKEYVEND